MLGFTFDSVGEWLSGLAAHVRMFTAMEQKGVGDGICVLPIKRIYWQIKSFLIMHTDVPKTKAIAWLKALPSDSDFYQYSMIRPMHDLGALFGACHQTCWIALAHEKVGLYEGALRFCKLAAEPDLLKAGAPYTKWALTITHACQGRVLAKLNRHTDALASFQAAIEASKQSYPMIEALAYREMANAGAGAKLDRPTNDAAADLVNKSATDDHDAFARLMAAGAHARDDLEQKMKAFGGRLTRAEFNTLTIAPPT